MANGLTVEKLFQLYEDEKQSFAQDVYDWFEGTGDRDEWERDYGMYLPTYDPTDVEFAGLERDIDLQRATDVLDISEKASGRAYKEGLDTLSTSLGKALGGAKATTGSIGLRSGALASAIEDTIATSGNKARDLGDRMSIQQEEDDNIYNTAIVDTALDFDKSERQAEQELYDRTLAMIARISELGAFKEDDIISQCPDDLVDCGDFGCISKEECDHNEQVVEETTFNVQCDNGMWVEKDSDCAFIGSGGGGTVESFCTQEDINNGCRQTTTTYNPNSFDPLGLGDVEVSHCYCAGYGEEPPPEIPGDFSLGGDTTCDGCDCTPPALGDPISNCYYSCCF